MLCPIWLFFFFFSSTSLSLKTPFVDAQTERRGLQRRVRNRRKLTEEEFGQAVKERQSGSKCDDIYKKHIHPVCPAIVEDFHIL